MIRRRGEDFWGAGICELAAMPLMIGPLRCRVYASNVEAASRRFLKERDVTSRLRYGLGLANGKANVDPGEADGPADSLGEGDCPPNSGAIDDDGLPAGDGDTVGLGVGVGNGGMMLSQ